MPNDMTTFTTPENLGGMNIRVVQIEGNPWFVAADVCRALGIDIKSETHSALRFLADDEQRIGTPDLIRGLRTGQTKLISESGLYKLIMRSDTPEARSRQGNPVAPRAPRATIQPLPVGQPVGATCGGSGETRSTKPL